MRSTVSQGKGQEGYPAVGAGEEGFGGGENGASGGEDVVYEQEVASFGAGVRAEVVFPFRVYAAQGPLRRVWLP